MTAISNDPYNIGSNPKLAGSADPEDAENPSPEYQIELVKKPNLNSFRTGRLRCTK